MRTFYEILSVAPVAEDVVVEGAYKALLRRYHPDVAKVSPAEAERRTKEINEAYQTLRDPTARARYDAKLAADAPAPSARPEPPAPPPMTRHAPVAPRPGGALSAALFSALAITVLVGAIGSLGMAGQGSPSLAPSGGELTAAGAGAALSTPPSAAREEAIAPSATPTFSPSFDCTAADDETQKLICADEELAQADTRMADAYREALVKAPDPEALRRSQRAWLVDRDEGHQDREALSRIYAARIEELERPVLEEPIF